MQTNTLVIGKAYAIRFAGFHGYDAYNGLAVYTGETDNIDGEVFGFRIESFVDTCFFALEDIFENT